MLERETTQSLQKKKANIDESEESLRESGLEDDGDEMRHQGLKILRVIQMRKVSLTFLHLVEFMHVVMRRL